MNNYIFIHYFRACNSRVIKQNVKILGTIMSI